MSDCVSLSVQKQSIKQQDELQNKDALYGSITIPPQTVDKIMLPESYRVYKIKTISQELSSNKIQNKKMWHAYIKPINDNLSNSKINLFGQEQMEIIVPQQSNHLVQVIYGIKQSDINHKKPQNLIEKIKILQTKVKQLEEEKKKGSQISEHQKNQSTAPSQSQSEGGLQNIENGQKTTLPQDNSHKNIQNKLNSKIYNLIVGKQNKNDNIQQQINQLKNKLILLQNIRINKDQQQLLNLSKISTPRKKQLQGKIVKINGSIHSRYTDNVGGVDGSHLNQQVQQSKLFVRNNPQKSLISKGSMQKHNKNKGTSQAIFRKNTGMGDKKTKNPLLSQDQKWKMFQNDNPDSQANLKKKIQLASKSLKNYPQIYLPQFTTLPTPQDSQDQLIQLGKNMFIKLGCQIDDKTMVNVKKYKNCVFLTLRPKQNILWHYEGRFYFGDWKNNGKGDGQKQGQGLQYQPGKYKYKGCFKDGKRQGYGQMIYQNNSVYLGNWHQGQKHGKGRTIQEKGLIYNGEFKQGKRSGHGKIFNNDKLEFDGLFYLGNKNGFGKQYFLNGDCYEGEYSNNKFEGRGKYIWKSRAVYKGQFREGKRHGRGIWQSGDKLYDTFEGEYNHDNKNGYGVYTWANGAIFKGNFLNDLKHGDGAIIYPNGNVVSLTWKNGVVVEKRGESSQGYSRTYQKTNQSMLLQRKNGSRPSQQLKPSKSVGIQKLIRQNQNQKKREFRSKINNTDNHNNNDKLGIQKTKSQIIVRKKREESVKEPPYKCIQTSGKVNLNL